MPDAARKTLLLVYHSWTGATEQMIHAVARGAACEPDVRVRLLRAVEAGPEDLLAADGYVFATPENLAAIAGLMKDFFGLNNQAAGLAGNDLAMRLIEVGVAFQRWFCPVTVG